MKTTVIMKRKLFNKEISQRTDNNMFSATDLIDAGNLYRLSNGMKLFNLNTWLSGTGVKEFIAELEKEFGKVRISSRGKNSHNWMHPLLFIDLALAISPKLKIETYKWLYDELINNRKDSCDSYKKMCGCLYVRHGSKQTFGIYVSDVAKKIRYACNVTDWQKANESQLNKRDTIHENIALLADVLDNNIEAVRIGILKSGSKT